MVTPGQVQFYREQGYLVVENLFTPEECDQLNEHVRDIVEGRVKLTDPHEIRMEPDAEEQGLLTPENRYDYLFKIGHHMHHCDEMFRYSAAHPRIVAVLQALIGPDIKCVQTMFIDKPPNIGVGQPFHQDSWYLKTDPDTLTAAWVACDDVDEENGCLRVIPGSHKEPIHQHEKPEDPAKRIYAEVAGSEERAKVVLPLKKGSGVLFPGHMLHSSGNNHTTRKRRAFVAHYADAKSRWLSHPRVQALFTLVSGREYPGCL